MKFAKSTGSKGIHVYVPIVRGPVQKDVWTFAKALAVALAQGRQQHGRYFANAGATLLGRGHLDAVHCCLPLPLCLLLICGAQPISRRIFSFETFQTRPLSIPARLSASIFDGLMRPFSMR